MMSSGYSSCLERCILQHLYFGLLTYRDCAEYRMIIVVVT